MARAKIISSGVPTAISSNLRESERERVRERERERYIYIYIYTHICKVVFFFPGYRLPSNTRIGILKRDPHKFAG